MGVIAERIAVLLLLPWSSKMATGDLETHSRRTYCAPSTRAEAGPVWKIGREHSPSSSVQRADLEALRAFSRVR